MSNANFTPVFDGYSGQRPFRYWCQTVLPLVYDDSLSYYELLNKVVYYLNNVISDIANVECNTEKLLNAFEQLQNYVNDYFNNLDLQEEINKKLDEMSVDGTLAELINDEIFSSIQNQITTLNNGVTNLTNNKISKDEVGYVTMNSLSDEVKNAMLTPGAAVPTVGNQSITAAQIVNNTITSTKIQNSVLPVNLNAHGNNKITINRNTNTIKFSENFYLTTGGRTTIITGSPEVAYPTSGFYWITVSPDNLSTVNFPASRNANDYVLGRVYNGTFLFASEVNVEDTNSFTFDETHTSISDVTFTQRVIVDFASSTIKMPRKTKMFFNLLGKRITVNTIDDTQTDYQGDLSMDIQLGCVCYNTQTNMLVINSSYANIPANLIPIGCFNTSNNSANMIIPYTVISSTANLYACQTEIAAFGDSITAGAGSTRPYVDVIEKISGMRLLNYGIGSSAFAYNLAPGSQHVSGDGNTEQGTTQAVPENNTIKDRTITYIAQQNSADNILLFGGTNDFIYQTNLIGSGTAIERFEAALSDTISACLNAGKFVGVIGPLRRKVTTTYTYSLEQFNEAMKSVCKQYGVPFLNLYDSSGLDPNVDAIREKYFADGVHPNNAGSVKLGVQILAFVKQYFGIAQDL